MDILLAFVLIAVIVLIGWVGIIWGIILPSKAEEHELLKLEEKVEYLKLQIKYLETKEEGEYLAYRLARAQGYSTEEAERVAFYNRNCCVVIDPPMPNTAIATYSWEQAEQELNRLVAKKHNEDCLHLSKEEEKLILDRRNKDFDSRWVEVKPKPRKAAVARKGKKK